VNAAQEIARLRNEEAFKEAANSAADFAVYAVLGAFPPTNERRAEIIKSIHYVMDIYAGTKSVVSSMR
jgi:hypothetical protein